MAHPISFHSAKLSLFQSAISQATQPSEVQGLVASHNTMETTNRILQAHEQGVDLDSVVSDVLGTCIKLAFQYLLAKIEDNQQRMQDIINQLSESPCDPDWVEAVLSYIDFYWRGAAPHYVDYDDINQFIYPLPQPKSSEELVIGVIGDWGTGEPVARIALAEMFKQQPDLIIHVGDVYYSGTQEESRLNFEKFIDDLRADQPTPVYNLPGNHDYYSGGQPFYDRLPQLNATPHAPPDTPIQQASYFCLRNEHWQLQAMDTGFYDHDIFTVTNDITRLHDSETTWHRDKIASAGDRRIILFSHHQLFSAFTKFGGQSFNPNLYQAFEPALQQGRISAWLWGHAHLLEVYESYLGLPKGRCIGYSAFPVLTDSGQYVPLAGETAPLLPDPQQPGDFIRLGTSAEVYNHGYVILKLRGPDANGVPQGGALYYEVPGDGSSQSSTCVFQESL